MEETNQQDRFTSPFFSLDDLLTAIRNPDGKQVIVNGEDLEEIKRKRELNKNDNNGKGDGLAVLFIFFFIAMIIGMVVFAQTEKLLAFPCFGLLLLVIGISAVRQTKLSLDNAPVLAFPIIGLLLTVIPLIMYYQKIHPGALSFITITTDNVIDLCTFVTGIVGVLITVLPILNHNLKMNRCSKVIEAQCIYRNIKIKRSEKANGRNYNYGSYSPTWQYEMNGKIYVTTETAYTSSCIPGIGDSQEIRIDPDDPTYIYRPLAVKTAAPLITGIMMMLMGFGIFIARTKHII